MITEDYVSFEVAKLLKEKGFDEPCLQMWECGPDKKYLFRLQSSCYQNITEEDSCLAPTHQMAMKWLREKHHLWCEISPEENNWFVEIYSLKAGEYIMDKPLHNIPIYEDAVEAALKYSLENLL